MSLKRIVVPLDGSELAERALDPGSGSCCGNVGQALLIMSSHGRSGVNRWIYSSVADKVLHNAPCAKVIIHSQVTLKNYSTKRFLVPLDGSSIAEQALWPRASSILPTANRWI
jgi:hypothetical protein